MISPQQQLSIMVKQLRQLEACEEVTDNAHAVLSDDNLLVARIRCKATKLLLDDGHPNTGNLGAVQGEGFRVCSEEEDLFGWVSGAIFTRKGRIVF